MNRRRTPPRGWPVETHDDDETPPPQEMPLPASSTSYDSIPPPIREQLDMLATGLGDVTRAIGKVWDARRDGERLDRVDAKLATLASAATRHETVIVDRVIPQLEQLAAATDGIARELPRIAATLEGLAITVGALDRRLRDLEVQLRTDGQRWDKEHSATAVRVEAAEAQVRAHELRLQSLESAAAVSKALAKNERRKSGGLGAALGTLAGAIASAVYSWLK